ncbi:MKRN2 opposite strand protein isoform X1 [Chiloscyllium plagiosum]|uniref:MKRN2 opposite strand protein isoform X1 n=1 Tax=Chiloscyllium plagiosum TaxID=36176 RepID=UPI001CB831E0|nr:MKRN2 opposite strand protein isoform X1 [Chiloscyllium plagiosum]
MENRVVMFRHCGKDIYCFNVPEQCPICGQSLLGRRLEDAPVSIPNSFVDGHHEKCSFLIKPTKGSFLRDYDGRSDLHVGISNTSGVVYNYIETGVQRDGCGWEECVCVPLVQPDMYSLINQWDIYLEQFSTADLWLPNRYNEYEHNCYSYALTFINRVLAAQSKRQLSRTEFTERFVVPQTKRASRYITLHRELCRSYFYITDGLQSEEISSRFF